MDYKNIYENFINSRKGKIFSDTEYYETHHILPKSLGGDNNIENLIKLSAREHYFAHLLLAKFAGPKMKIALAFFIDGRNKYGGGCKYIPHSSKIGKLREDASKAKSVLMKGRIISEEHRKKISNSAKGRTPWNKDKILIDEKYKGGRKNKGKAAWNSGITGKEYTEKYKKGGLAPPRHDGSKWINNGIETKKLSSGLPIPDGYTQGRLSISGSKNPMSTKKQKIRFTEK